MIGTVGPANAPTQFGRATITYADRGEQLIIEVDRTRVALRVRPVAYGVAALVVRRD